MIVKERQLRQTIVRIGQLMYDKGFICASDGNISARIAPNRILITPSGLHKGLLEPEQLVVVDEQGHLIKNHSPLKPTSELPMHLEAYRQRPDIQAVVHAHPPISVALSIAGISMADCLLPEVIVFVGLVPTTAYATPSSTENVQAIRDLIPYHDALILQRHGSLTVGKNPMEAFMRLETVEQNARIGFMLAQLGVHNPLPANEVQKLLQQRAKMGLTRAGETALFCETCGVCHPHTNHTDTLRPDLPSTAQPQTVTTDIAQVRALVSQMVHQLVGDTSPVMKRWLWLAIGFVLLVACGRAETPEEVLVTLIPTAVPPPSATPVVQGGMPLVAEHPVTKPVETAIPPTPTITPLPVSAGIRASEAKLEYRREPLPEPPANWRPPPYQVPLSLHPDDHYWMIRPLPSGSRNYDLEWYPFGSDVMIADLFPYRIHHGIDFPNSEGTPIVAASSGTVVWAGPRPSATDGVNYYGNTVIIKHDWQWRNKPVYTLYAHTLELFVEVGDWVEQGQLIAGVGASGEVSGSHLHMEVRIGVNGYDNVYNPLLWIAPYEGWGTLAGRFVDRDGDFIQGAEIRVSPVDVDTDNRSTLTYSSARVRSDDAWQENFVVADLPAGEYTVLLSSNGRTFRRTLQVMPGRTNFVVVSADFQFVPTPTPIPIPTTPPTPLPPPPESES